MTNVAAGGGSGASGGSGGGAGAGGRFRVAPDVLRAAADRQQSHVAEVDNCARRLQAALPTGNAFGMIGVMTGVEGRYDDWAAGEASALRDLARLLGDLGEGLRHAAQTYLDVDDAATTGIDGLRAGVQR